MLTNSILSFPQMAPLSSPMVLHLLRISDPERVQQILHQPDRERHIHQKLQENITNLAQQVYQARRTIFLLLDQAIEAGEIHRAASVQWFAHQLSTQINEHANHRIRKTESKPARRYQTSAYTIAEYRKNYLLRPSEPYQPIELNCVAAILIAARVDGRLQGFMPPFIEADEPFWTCYLQRAHDAPIETCMYPLPPTLPTGAIIWSPWCPTDDPCWKDYGIYGAIRFSDAIVKGQKGVRWTISKKMLRDAWPSDFSSQDVGLVLDVWGQEAHHNHADAILNELAQSRLLKAS